jgi:5'-nucleotidase
MGLPIAVRETTIGHTAGMPEPVAILTVAITARALFHMEDSHGLFEAEGVKAYAEFQREREDDVLEPGIAFPLVRKLLALNDGTPADAPRVEVILLSRNSSDTGLRVFNSIQHYGLDIRRATFTSPARRCGPTSCRSARSCSCPPIPESVRSALEAGVAAATILPGACAGVAARPVAHRIRRRRGDLRRRERAGLARTGRGGVWTPRARTRARAVVGRTLPRLPVGTARPAGGVSAWRVSPIRTALVTARSAPAHERVIRTLREWEVRLDEALFLGGRDKGPFLQAFGADIFFDDSPHNIDSARLHVAAGHVPHGVANEPARCPGSVNPRAGRSR